MQNKIKYILIIVLLLSLLCEDHLKMYNVSANTVSECMKKLRHSGAKVPCKYFTLKCVAEPRLGSQHLDFRAYFLLDYSAVPPG